MGKIYAWYESYIHYDVFISTPFHDHKIDCYP